MARLPVPGSDDGVWGSVLNDYLAVEHNTDGTLKLRTDGTLDAFVRLTGDQTVAGVKTFSSSPVVPTPVDNTDAANKAYVDSVASSGAPDADATTKGLVQLAGDLGGTAASPTVPGLATKQDADADLTAIAGLSPTNDDILQRKAGAWTNRTPAQLKVDLALAQSDVGLGNVDNTADADKPVSTATQTALDGKLNLTGGTVSGALTAQTLQASGLTGATSAFRFVGATTSGAPASGTFAVGDVVVSRDGAIYICTTAGSPGTWTNVDSGAGGAMLLAGGNNPTITSNALTNGFARIDLNYSAGGSTPDAFSFYYNGVRTGYHNEKGELRARAAADNSVPFRVQQRSTGQSVNLTEWTQSDNTVLASVGPTGIITAPNVDRKVSYGASQPSSPEVGDLWVQP